MAVDPSQYRQYESARPVADDRPQERLRSIVITIASILTDEEMSRFCAYAGSQTAVGLGRDINEIVRDAGMQIELERPGVLIRLMAHDPGEDDRDARSALYSAYLSSAILGLLPEDRQLAAIKEAQAASKAGASPTTFDEIARAAGNILGEKMGKPRSASPVLREALEDMANPGERQKAGGLASAAAQVGSDILAGILRENQ